jgi:Imidazoleglycerol-phosphate synthase
VKKVRLIARLDVKSEFVVKGIQLEGLRKIGNPNELAKKYYLQGVDEILYMDIVASLYNRNNLKEIVLKSTKNVFVPITVGGGIRNIEDVSQVLKSGADKVAINTAAIKNPEIISEVAKRYGSQCMVLSIEAKKNVDGKWEAYYDNGREHSCLDVIEWAKKGEELGAGEILITSVDKEGMQKGIDNDLIKKLCEIIKIPVIISGGVGSMEDIVDAIDDGASAVAIASVLHYNKTSIEEIKKELNDRGKEVRM